MTIRRSKKLSWRWKNRKSLKKRLRDKSRRDMRLEPLEDRRLLTNGPLAGPELAGIQLNDGTLLKNGQVHNVAPDTT